MTAELKTVIHFEKSEAPRWPSDGDDEATIAPPTVDSPPPTGLPRTCHLKEIQAFSAPQKEGRLARIRAEFRTRSGGVLRALLGPKELEVVMKKGRFAAVRFPDTGERWHDLSMG
jgi:hypothetical protein